MEEANKRGGAPCDSYLGLWQKYILTFNTAGVMWRQLLVLVIEGIVDKQ